MTIVQFVDPRTANVRADSNDVLTVSVVGLLALLHCSTELWLGVGLIHGT